MGSELSTLENVNQRNRSVDRSNNTVTRKGKPGRRQKQQDIDIVAIDVVILVINHFFPMLNQWFNAINDPRDSKRVTYSVIHLIYETMLMFLLQLGSRNQLRQEKKSELFRKNLLVLSGSNEDFVADTDTLNYLLKFLPFEELEVIPSQMVRSLIRGKVLDSFRFEGCFRIAIDGVNVLSFPYKHCDKCLVKKHNDKHTTYHHDVLEAKLVTSTGLAFSLISIPIENIDGEYDKQDCETKAFYRLTEVLRARFPKLPICLLLDGLYTQQHVFKICEKNNWSFFITFKEGSLPIMHEEFERQKALHSENYLQEDDGQFIINYYWAHNLSHKKNTVHVIEARHTEKNQSRRKNQTKQRNNIFKYITDLRPEKVNIKQFINLGGRQRWKIENSGFNVQKNKGYELEHNYGAVNGAWKNYYSIMQISHIIMQLITNTDIVEKTQRIKAEQKANKNLSQYERKKLISLCLTFHQAYNTVRNFAKRLAESIRNELFSDFALSEALAHSIQIRFIEKGPAP